ncbi:hypothetical protein [Bilifractor porci]|uniref:Uncharacterized protein n=1 Tax=Bilifractor porci TaxID=2606636 RepID=A0A7X2P7P2_9FIRM|nr:hypothetical protein [Bilifractor porci]MST81661.1 hypothetical protein [Bilifractor porci]
MTENGKGVGDHRKEQRMGIRYGREDDRFPRKGRGIVIRTGMAQENPANVSRMNHPVRKSLWISDEGTLDRDRIRAMRQGFCFQSPGDRDRDHRTF